MLGLHRCARLFSSCGPRASHCGGFSCCRVQALGEQASAVVGLSCPVACGIFLEQGSNPSVLQGGFLTTGPPGMTLLVAQMVNRLSTMQETQVRSLGWEDPWVGKIPWRRKWQSTLVLLPGKSHGQRSLVGHSPWGCKESDTTERLHVHVHGPPGKVLESKLFEGKTITLCFFVSDSLHSPHGLHEVFYCNHRLWASSLDGSVTSYVLTTFLMCPRQTR